ncbi:MAG TPA: tetratricopeptide repeat protein [Phycisphaerales bacterium]|nr:tetratricopeptide repeat protein [Phycisphaerales bacterium]HMP35831.1 tetratricopeptide repeat protein [Phycisphaerales bacterium]
MSCAPSRDGGVAISLPVVDAAARAAPRVRPSRSAKWRWTVLLTIQVLMILHVVQWLVSGRTTTPIEPSEAMEAVKHGIVNVGAIFFGAALLSTAIFGRWVCGWACHVVLLQDFCAWLLSKAGLRPHPFRARLLMFLPLILALYMFVWPLVYRFAIAPFTRPDLRWPGWSLHLTTENFWATFPGPWVAVPFLFVCGFATVYFLGSKGYCTYGCPYGGFFAPLDELAPARIRVTDACEGCGHCTAVCTSNVRVHEEVRDFGMVVDPGCMKCMDCVSVCPKEALYFGFGKPASGKRPRVAPELAARRRWDLSWPEEIGFGIVAIVVFFSVYGAYGGVYGVVPLLFASGITICLTWLAWKAYRVLRDANAHLHGRQLRRRGRFTATGAAFLAGTALVALLVLHTGAVNVAATIAGFSDERVTVPAGIVFSEAPMELDPAMRAHAERGLRAYGVASYVGDGGIGLAWSWQPHIDRRRAWLLATLHRWEDAESLLRGSIERYGDHEGTHAGVARLLRAQQRHDEAAAYARAVLARRPDLIGFADETASVLEAQGRSEEAIDLCREILAAVPYERNRGSLTIMRRLSLLLIMYGEGERLDEGIELVRRTLEIAPDNAFAHYALALGLGKRGDFAGAERELRRALEIAPDNRQLNAAMADFLRGVGRSTEAEPYERRMAELSPG